MDKWLNHPTSLKLISVALAMLLWAVVHFDLDSPSPVTSSTDTREIEAVKVNVTGLDSSAYELRLIEPSVVDIMVRGTRSDLLKASKNDYKVSVDVSNVTHGEHLLPLKVDLPNRIQQVEVSPNRVTVQLVPLLTEEFDIQIVATGKPAHDYTVGEPIVKPGSRVFVTLPQDQLNQVGMVGAPISVENEEDTVNERRVRLIVYDKQGEEMPEAVIEPAVVEVEVPITKPFKQLPLSIGFSGKLPESLGLVSITPEVETITVYGPQVELDKYESYDNVIINLAAVRQSGNLSYDLKPMNGIASIAPAKLSVAIEVAASETRTIPQVPIAVTGLSDGLETEFEDPQDGMMDIAVRGAPSLLAELGARDIKVLIDVNGLAPGTHEVPIEVQLPSYIDLDSGVKLTARLQIIDSTAVVAPEYDETADTDELPGNGSNTPGNASNSTDTLPDSDSDPDTQPQTPPDEQPEPPEQNGEQSGEEPGSGADDPPAENASG